MNLHEQIEYLVYQAVDELNDMLLPEQRLEKLPDTLLLGKGAKIDSMAVVSLIVALEEKINDTYSLDLILADEGALVIESSPFRTIKLLVEHLKNMVNKSHESN